MGTVKQHAGWPEGTNKLALSKARKQLAKAPFFTPPVRRKAVRLRLRYWNEENRVGNISEDLWNGFFS